jgi:hypothetical protein
MCAMKTHRPPIGLKKRSIHDGDRIIAICTAIISYKRVPMTIPEEWTDELFDLLRGKESLRYGAES